MTDDSGRKPRRRARARGDAEHGDPAVLAERFLDLWQDQIAAVATDPDLAELIARLWSQWLVGPTAWQPAAAGRLGRARRARSARDRGRCRSTWRPRR